MGTAKILHFDRTSGPTDASLVESVLAGERAAAEALFRRHAGRINGLAFRLMGRDADVDDLVQDAFAGAFAGLERLKDPQAFGGFVAAILVRTAAKTIRRRRVAARLGLGSRALSIDLDALIGPGVPADQAVELRRIYTLAVTLPDTLRIPLVLHRVEGSTLDEIATYIGCSLATVKRRIAEAEALLRERFEDGEARR